MKKHLRAMLEAIISDDTDAASKHLHDYLAAKTRGLVLGEAEDKDDDEKEEDKDEEKEDKKDDDKDDEKEDKDDDDDEKEEKVDEAAMSHDASMKNRKGEAHTKVPHKDNSRGYGHEKSKANARKLKADGKSGAHEKKGDAMKAPHKDNSRSAKSEDKGAKGLKDAPKGTQSPHGDGKKEDRR